MRTELEQNGWRAAPGPATLTYLESRVREEALAAVAAPSIEATLVHLVLATAYARHYNERTDATSGFEDRAWVEVHRVW